MAAIIAIRHACKVAMLTTNKAKEDAAIAWVIQLERAAGRQPRDTRYTGAPADIESPPRLIEVKSFGTINRGYELLMEVRQGEEARRNPDYYALRRLRPRRPGRSQPVPVRRTRRREPGAAAGEPVRHTAHDNRHRPRSTGIPARLVADR